MAYNLAFKNFFFQNRMKRQKSGLSYIIYLLKDSEKYSIFPEKKINFSD